MVNREKRGLAADLLRALIDARVTNDEFFSRYPRDSGDPALRGIFEKVWSFYSDLRTHKLIGSYSPSPHGRALLERCHLFLNTDLEFGWPPPLLNVPLTMLSIATLGLVARIHEKKYARLGDYDVWPFLRKIDYEAHARREGPQVE